jgi:hypothetical protein
MTSAYRAQSTELHSTAGGTGLEAKIIKVTVARDFWPLVFFINQSHLDRWLELGSLFPEIFKLDSYSPGSDIPQKFTSRGIIPHGN